MKRIITLFGVITVLFLEGCAPSKRMSHSSAPAQKESVTKGTSKTSTSTIKKEKQYTSLDKAVNSYLGIRYRSGGTSRKGFDCSGFVWRVYQDIGHSGFKRTSARRMYKLGKRVTRKNLQKGDLCFFRGLSHVGIYMGNGEFAHASSSKGITYSSLDTGYWSKRIVGFRRIY